MTEKEALESVTVVPEIKDKKKRKRKVKTVKEPKKYGFVRELKEVYIDFS